MPRTPKLQAEAERAARSVVDLVGPAKRRSKKRAPSPSYVRRIMADVKERIAEDQWADAKPRDLVGLYLVLHEWCYGVEAAEVVGVSWNAAVSAAGKLVRDEFGDDPRRAVDFIRWVWKREKEREAWRRQNGQAGGRIGWRLQFCARTFVTDYRIHIHRSREGG